AVALAVRASQLAGAPEAAVFDTLAAAYAEAGRFHEAELTARRAIALAPQDAALRARLALYEAKRAYRQ
ncbi:MAG TPA: hypothetical protein VHA11_13610, partial [Bryobacteraceae bacterium]|nr:hypothetical protein [Bryobacteraceae bacterium]